MQRGPLIQIRWQQHCPCRFFELGEALCLVCGIPKSLKVLPYILPRTLLDADEVVKKFQGCIVKKESACVRVQRRLGIKFHRQCIVVATVARNEVLDDDGGIK